MEISFTIYAKPTTKKNSQKIAFKKSAGRLNLFKMKGSTFYPVTPVIVQGDAYKEYQARCRPYMPNIGEPISEPVNLKAVYYMPTANRVDLVNLHEALQDILVFYGILADDNCHIIVSTDGSRVLVDRKNPRTEVTLESVT